MSKKEEQPVYIKCNVERPGGARCKGNQARIVRRTPRSELGGQSVMYQCTTCKGAWTLTY